MISKIKHAHTQNGMSFNFEYLRVINPFPTGIIINEILTHSCKYAFPPQSARENGNIISIALRKTADNKVKLDINDSGAGFAVSQTPGAKKSFGLRLIELLTKQLKASVSVDSNSGTAYRIIFPIETVKY